MHPSLSGLLYEPTIQFKSEENRFTPNGICVSKISVSLFPCRKNVENLLLVLVFVGRNYSEIEIINLLGKITCGWEKHALKTRYHRT